jgi:hypothetical protein
VLDAYATRFELAAAPIDAGTLSLAATLEERHALRGAEQPRARGSAGGDRQHDEQRSA